jgi:hypothetical protein
LGCLSPSPVTGDWTGHKAKEGGSDCLVMGGGGECRMSPRGLSEGIVPSPRRKKLKNCQRDRLTWRSHWYRRQLYLKRQ